MDWWINAIASIVPSLLIGLLFWMIMRGIVRVDAGERKAYSAALRREREKRGLPVGPDK